MLLMFCPPAVTGALHDPADGQEIWARMKSDGIAVTPMYCPPAVTGALHDPADSQEQRSPMKSDGISVSLGCIE